jgi:hypothetical protein
MKEYFLLQCKYFNKAAAHKCKEVIFFYTNVTGVKRKKFYER